MSTVYRPVGSGIIHCKVFIYNQSASRFTPDQHYIFVVCLFVLLDTIPLVEVTLLVPNLPEVSTDYSKNTLT